MLLRIEEVKDRSGVWNYTLIDEDPDRTRPKFVTRVPWGYGVKSRREALQEILRLADYVLRAYMFRRVNAYDGPKLRVVK